MPLQVDQGLESFQGLKRALPVTLSSRSFVFRSMMISTRIRMNRLGMRWSQWEVTAIRHFWVNQNQTNKSEAGGTTLGRPRGTTTALENSFTRTYKTFLPAILSARFGSEELDLLVSTLQIAMKHLNLMTLAQSGGIESRSDSVQALPTRKLTIPSHRRITPRDCPSVAAGIVFSTPGERRRASIGLPR